MPYKTTHFPLSKSTILLPQSLLFSSPNMSSDQQQAPSPPQEVPWSQPNGIYATYDLHCHCGAIRYTMKISPPLYAEHTEGKEQCVAVECNCSYCERNGIIAVHPLANDVEFTQGLEDRAKYYTGMKKNPHWLICSHIGHKTTND